MITEREKQIAAYLPATVVLAELNRMVGELEKIGVPTQTTTMGGSFNEWSEQLKTGQTAWIYTLEQFRSITELMAYVETMNSRGVVVRSVKEAWFNDEKISGREVFGHLFRLGEAIHCRMVGINATTTPNNGQNEHRTPNTTSSKAQKAVELRTTRKMSVVAACRMAGCGVNAYYRYLKQQ